MNAAAVKYQCFKKAHITLKTQGVSTDPMYFDYCLKVFFSQYENISGKDFDYLIIDFIDSLRSVADCLRKRGFIDSFGADVPVELLLNSTYTDSLKIKAANHIIETLTGKSRNYWITEIDEA